MSYRIIIQEECETQWSTTRWVYAVKIENFETPGADNAILCPFDSIAAALSHALAIQAKLLDAYIFLRLEGFCPVMLTQQLARYFIPNSRF